MKANPPLWDIIFDLLAVLVIVAAIVLQFQGILQARDVVVVLLIFFCLLLLRPYIFAPIYLHRVHWLSAHSDYEEFHPEREVIPEEVWGHIQAAVGKLNDCGLKVVAHFRKSGHVPQAMGFITLMQSNDRITVAEVITILTTTNKPLVGHNTLLFITESEDGNEIVTSNNTKPSIHPRAKKRTALWLPEIRDGRKLYEFHQRFVKTFCETPKQLILNGNPAEYMKKHAEAEVARWVKQGYYKLDPASQAYRLTWKGAVLIAWKYLWPIRTIRRVRRIYRTKRLLQELEE